MSFTPQPAVQWLVHLLLENQLLNTDQIGEWLSHIGSEADLATAVEVLQSTGWVEDSAFLEQAAQAAERYAEADELPPLLPEEVFAAAESEFHAEGAVAAAPDFASLSGLDPQALRQQLHNLILYAQQLGASDLHLIAGMRPALRIYRNLEYLDEAILDPDVARAMNLSMLNEAQRKQFAEHLDLDYALTLPSEDGERLLRFRVNLMEQKEGIAGVYHILPEHLMSLEELGFPNAEHIRKLLSYHNGIILVTGPVGSGKTTTLSAIVNELNHARFEHIITIEDPIEIVQASAGCIVSQREIGTHTESYASALKSALREDPDIIVVGEIHDLATIEMAVTAAETGHLVVATMHTHDAVSTLGRMLDVFPPAQQAQIRAMTSGSLRGILCQRLLPGADGGVVLASELLVNNNAVSNLIREGRESSLISVMQTAKKQGMRLMDESIMELFTHGMITPDTAQKNVKDKKSLGRSK